MRTFAYGSNMLTARLAARVGAVRVVTTGRLVGYRLHFHKRGRDGSGKANALPTGRAEDVVWGVVFDIDDDAWRLLDGHEGAPLQYGRLPVPVEANGEPLEVVAYLARPDWISEGLAPFSWYKALVVAGAREHGLPGDYVARIEAEPESADPDRDRETRERKVLPCR